MLGFPIRIRPSICCACVQIGLGIAYTVTGGKSLQVIEEISKGCTFVDAEIGVESDRQDCNVNLTKYIFVFALFQVLLSQIPSFHHLWCAYLTDLLPVVFVHRASRIVS